MTYSVRDLIQKYNVTEATVLAWIHSGEMATLNVGKTPGKKKPRWRITEQALAEWERNRSTTAPPPKRRRKQKNPEITEYY